MSFKVTATIDKKDLHRYEKMIEAKYMRKVVAKSLNQSGTKLKNQISKELQTRIKSVPLKDIKQGIRLTRAKATDEIGSQEVQLKNSSKGIGFEHFGQKQTQAGVSIVVVGKPKLMAHSFIATMKGKSGYRGTFVRSVKKGGTARRVWKKNSSGSKVSSSVLPIVKKAYQLSTLYEMIRPEIQGSVSTAGGEEFFKAFEKNFKKEIEG